MSDTADLSFQSYPWRISYRTSTLDPEGRPTDILHDFYIPVLKRAVRYDRMAGYFRSSSLAAASQGFSAFTQNKGQARFIVGADLNTEDVQAVLSGLSKNDDSWLVAALNDELEHFESWPENVQNGVQLLAWMVAGDHLRLKVAFRVHAETGKPLPFDGLDDGYVHMKWGLFADEPGNRIYINGSLNESRTALCVNAENIDVHCNWKGEVEAERVRQADQEFETLWDNHNPHFSVLTLPEAVRSRLIKLAQGLTRPLEIDGSSEAPLEVRPPDSLERLTFALLADGPFLPGGRYVGLETAPVKPWPHQEVVAKRVLSTWPFSYLLCDEVGLGKTIEAGLIIRSLKLSGLAERILIAAPASLTRQWQREMADKFLLSFGLAQGGVPARHEYIFPSEVKKNSSSLFETNATIISTGLLVREDRSHEPDTAAEFDLVLLDEAHYARRKNATQGFRAEPKFGRLFKILEQRLRKMTKSLLLATATPMQLDAVEVFDLIKLTNRVSSFQFEPGLSAWFYDLLGSLNQDQDLSAKEWAFVRAVLLDVQGHDPFYDFFLKEAVVDSRIRTSVRRFLNDGRPPGGRDRQRMQRFFFAGSPLNRVMLRHTRPLLEIYRQKGELHANLAKREILPLPNIAFSDQERQCYEQLEAYCRELATQVQQSGDTGNRHAIGFYLSFLRLRFASSFSAIRQTLQRRLRKVEYTLEHHLISEQSEVQEVDLEDLLEAGDDDLEVVATILQNRSPQDLEWERDHLQGMLTAYEDLPAIPSKMQRLLRCLDQRTDVETNRIRQTVVFTRFYDTLQDVVQILTRQKPNILVGTYSGQGGQFMDPRTWRIRGVDRETIKHRFLDGEIDVLVCTDAAAEGLNLQTADMLINFDLPWNPMKVEQRIGRIDRIGQLHETVSVLNLCYLRSAEEIVYGRLLQRLRQTDNVVGTQQVSLLPVERLDFENLNSGVIDEARLEKKVRERLDMAKARISSREIAPEDLYEIYKRLSKSGLSPQIPVDLAGIWRALASSTYLRDLGCTVFSEARLQSLELRNLSGIPDKSVLTTSRDAYEYGLQEHGRNIHFASYGEPVFDALVSHFQEYELPDCMRRVTVEFPHGGEVVAYLAAVKERNGHSRIQLITSLKDLAGISLDEEGVISDGDVQEAEASLQEIALKDFRPLEMAVQLESQNARAGSSQLILEYLIVRSIIYLNRNIGTDKYLFWDEVRNIEESLQEKEALDVVLPADMAADLNGLLFPPTVYRTGNKAILEAPLQLVRIALDSVCRLADSLHIKKTDLETEQVLARLKKEIEKLLQQAS